MAVAEDIEAVFGFPSFHPPNFDHMKRMYRYGLIALATLMLLVACAKVPFTQRRQAKLIPTETVNQMSFQQYDQFLQQNPPLRSGEDVRMVRQIGQDLVEAVEAYYRANGLQDQLSQFQWEFNVVEDPNINAFCMPGGKVVIFTGILPVCRDRDGLAVVMGHEIAHALAHHGNERMSQQMGVNGTLSVLNAALGVRAASAQTAAEAQKRQQAQQLIMMAAGAGAQLGVLLPYSRAHESEADRIGLYLMAIAGYDVSAAAPFWERMQAKSGGSPPEFLSTHPSPDTRSENLRKWAPEARELARKY